MIADTVTLVCSNRPRPSMRTSGKGNQWWTREVFHLTHGGDRTMCGVRCSEWLTIRTEESGRAAIERDCCGRCAVAVSKLILPAEPSDGIAAARPLGIGQREEGGCRDA